MRIDIKYIMILSTICILGCSKQEFKEVAQNTLPFTKSISIDDAKSLYKNEPIILSEVFYIEGIVVGLEDDCFYLQEKAGSGIKILRAEDQNIEPGQLVKVKIGGNTLSKVEGVFVLSGISELELLGNGSSIPTTLSIEDMKNGFYQYASSLISLNDVEIEKVQEVPEGILYELTDVSGTIRSFLPSGSDYMLPDAAAMITGVLVKGGDELYLNTRSESDIQDVAEPPTLFEQIIMNSDLVKTVVYDNEVQLSAGVKQIQGQYINNADLLTAFTLFEVDLNVEGTSLEVGLANNGNNITARHSLVNMATTKDAALAASGWQVLGGITGDFSTASPVAPQRAHEPFGAVIKNGVELRSSFYDGREFFGLKKDGTPIIGDQVLYGQIKSDLAEALGGRLILENGEIVNKVPARAPRPGIGYTDDNKVYLFVGDGAQPEWSNGYNTEEIAKLLSAVGVTNAVYLQGGNYAMGVGKNLNTNIISNVTRPSWNHDAWMSSSWIITAKKED